MGSATYEIAKRGELWTVVHDGATTGDYVTKEAAFEAAMAAASVTIRQGHEIRISVPGPSAETSR